MSPYGILAMLLACCFPRVSGDEPSFAAGGQGPRPFSPRERG